MLENSGDSSSQQEKHLNPDKFHYKRGEYTITNSVLMLKQCFIEIGCRDIFDINDIMYPEWIRWREFLSAFIHFMKFVDETDQNEEELRLLEQQLEEKQFQVDKATQNLEAVMDSNEEFELDELEITLTDQMPTIMNQYKTLQSTHRNYEEDIKEISQKADSLKEELSLLKQELEQWRMQVVRSPEKIAQMKTTAKIECEEVMKKNEELNKQQNDQMTLIYELKGKILTNFESLVKEANYLKDLSKSVTDKQNEVKRDQEQNQ